MTIQQHFYYVQLALVFLTRLPVKLNGEVTEQDINRSSAYFGLVGAIVALLVALVSWPLALVLPIEGVVVLSLIASLMITGAFHEDGLADTADGFGGGWQQQQKLTIMKDSRLGTYGASALFLSLLLKYQLLVTILENGFVTFVCALLAAHMISRVFAVSYIGQLPYVQVDGESKTKPVAQSLPQGSWTALNVTLLVAAVILWLGLVFSIFDIVMLAVILLLVRVLFLRFIQSQIQGYTGDVLGAAQQVAENICYIMFIILLGLTQTLQPVGGAFE